MIYYHGTTLEKAKMIVQRGFLPKSGWVWFSQLKWFTQTHARYKALYSSGKHEQAIAFACDLNVKKLRAQLGEHRVTAKGHVLTVGGFAQPSVLRAYATLHLLDSYDAVAAWVRHFGWDSPRALGDLQHGIRKLSRWVRKCLTTGSRTIQAEEFMRKGNQWLPEVFALISLDPRLELLPVERSGKQGKTGVFVWSGYVGIKKFRQPSETDGRPVPQQHFAVEEEALVCLTSDDPLERIRGLKLLAESKVDHLFSLCILHLGDVSRDVVLTALQTMLVCQSGDPEVIVPYATSSDKKIRAAAIAALAKHTADETVRWFEIGLSDPEVCVRLGIATLLLHLDPLQHQDIFELAYRDPNPEIRRLAHQRAKEILPC
jgi:hypothetical protein